MPPGCSTQSNGDWAAHYNSNSAGQNDGRSDEYTPVCGLSAPTPASTQAPTPAAPTPPPPPASVGCSGKCYNKDRWGGKCWGCVNRHGWCHNSCTGDYRDVDCSACGRSCVTKVAKYNSKQVATCGCGADSFPSGTQFCLGGVWLTVADAFGTGCGSECSNRCASVNLVQDTTVPYAKAAVITSDVCAAKTCAADDTNRRRSGEYTCSEVVHCCTSGGRLGSRPCAAHFVEETRLTCETSCAPQMNCLV